MITINYESGNYVVQTTLPLNNFNYELLQRVFQLSFKQKGTVSGMSRFNKSSDLCAFVEKWFNISSLLIK